MNGRIGHCFRLCLNFIVDNEGYELVHGIVKDPTGRGRYSQLAHAWLEKDGVVYDITWDIEMPVEAYYRFFRAEERARYNRIEAAKLSIETRHSGPWGDTIDFNSDVIMVRA